MLKAQARVDEALASFGRAVQLKPDVPQLESNLVYTLVFHPDYDAASILDAARAWDRRHAAPLARSARPHENDRDPGRRVRVGYVSPDFREHVVGRNLLPLLREHDHRRFEIFCYSDVARPDVTTASLRSCADAWRETYGLEDERLAQWIREDRIDVLVDTTMHMAFNRLPVFARKPAPVEVCGFAYPGTTGLSAMDYRLTDPHLDPPGPVDRFYSEESIRLADSFWCYDPLTIRPEVGPLPALQNGYVTFGCLSNFCKINAAVLGLWAELLAALPGSRLVLMAPEGSHRRRAMDILQRAGVPGERLSFALRQPFDRYLGLYRQIDVGLDPFPYNGHSTSLDSFWMGVPVVTLVGRAGVSQLANLGLTELIGTSPEHYVRIAAELAADLPRLAGLRAELRGRMQRSPLVDAPRFARAIEAAYRLMWQRWCGR